MKRLHVHLGVQNLDQSVRFYSALFDAEPVVRKSDYAKWMLDDMGVNFAVTERQEDLGVDHLGIQVDSEEDLSKSEERLRSAGRPMVESDEVHCCYAQVEQAWTIDPQGVFWEAFRATGESDLYCDGGDPLAELRKQAETDCESDP